MCKTFKQKKANNDSTSDEWSTAFAGFWDGDIV